MLVNPFILGNGAAPVGNGYAEGNLLYYYDNASTKLTYGNNYDLGYDGSTAIIQAPTYNTSKGFTSEAYFSVTGAESSTFQRAWCIGANGNDINITVGTVSGLSDADFIFAPMVRIAANIDYEMPEIAGINFGDKHTFTIVSTPDPLETDPNTVSFYLDGVNVGTTFEQSRGTSIIITDVGIKDGLNVARPLNGTVYNGRFYTRALTAAEIVANHANDIAKYGGNE